MQTWREFAAEFAGTALLLVIGLSAVVVDFAEGSPVPDWIPDGNLRRLLTGIVFAGGATLIVYSPLGKRSGGHINPAVTLAFLRLGKITWRSAGGYLASQFLGALAGAAIVQLVWGSLAAQVDLGTTVPGHGGWIAALVAECAITFLLVALILRFVDDPTLMPFTAAAAGALVAFLVFVEAPVSGTSLNPARSLGPAIVAGDVRDVWLYLVAPPLGALLAVALYRRRRRTVRCGKLFHANAYDCRFLDCQYTPPHRRITANHKGENTMWRRRRSPEGRGDPVLAEA
jgi:aquaporin Z